MKRTRFVLVLLFFLFISGLVLFFSATFIGSIVGNNFIIHADGTIDIDLYSSVALITSRFCWVGGLVMSLISGFKLYKANWFKANTKEYFIAILAGFILILLRYCQYVLTLIDSVNYFLVLFGFPIIPAVCMAFLLKHERRKYVVLKVGIFIASSFFFNFIFSLFNLYNMLLNTFIPGYGNMSAGGGFALMVSSFFYYGITGVGVIFSILYSVFKKRNQD